MFSDFSFGVGFVDTTSLPPAIYSNFSKLFKYATDGRADIPFKQIQYSYKGSIWIKC